MRKGLANFEEQDELGKVGEAIDMGRQGGWGYLVGTVDPDACGKPALLYRGNSIYVQIVPNVETVGWFLV